MSSNTVELDENFIRHCLDNQEWHQVAPYLTEKFTVTVNQVTGEPNPLIVSESVIKILSNTLTNLADCILRFINEELLIVTRVLYRSLRNSVVFNPIAQNLIMQDLCVLSNTREILSSLTNVQVSSTNSCIAMVCQFLSNLVAKNFKNAVDIWENFSDIILQLYKVQDHSYHAAAVLYNILYLNDSLVSSCDDIYEYVIDLCCSKNVNEYDTFLLEVFVQNILFFSKYESYKVEHRLMVLSVIMDCTSASRKDNQQNFLNIVNVLATQFKKRSDCILKTVTSYVDQIEPQEVVLLLQILASLSANEIFHKYLQGDKALLINCTFLLRSIHSLGKETPNKFSAVQKLSEVSSGSDLSNDPTFGFKANLIRLMGNLCWKHKQNQDELRNLDAIPLLLDCCNIDARNPFILQWVILAVRNLCENNAENQAVIAAMNQQGVVDSATLSEMGFMLHNDGTNKIGIVPLEALKK